MEGELMMAIDLHCKNCGSDKSGEKVSQKGSDTIPIYECPDCGNVAAIGCDCGSPESHTEA